MFCKNCGSEIGESQEVCLKCGVPKNAGNNYCENCGEKVTSELQVICLKCGCSLKKKALEQNVQQKKNDQYLNGHDKVSIALLCFFFGCLGVHNFVLGETKKGLLKILMVFCFGISGILALIDFIQILCDKYVVSD